MNSAKEHAASARKTTPMADRISEYINGAIPYVYHVVENGTAEQVSGGVIAESLVTLYVNEQELATMMCSPLELEALAVGFLFSEGVIHSLDDLKSVRSDIAGTVVDVRLTAEDFTPPRRMILTSGCGGGVMLQDLTESYPALESDFVTTPSTVIDRMHNLKDNSRLYNLVRGVHTAILTDTEQVLVSAEDVGRHNAVDKVAGKALLQGVSTHNRLLLTSGRISSEMLGKARRMHIPIVASRTAPTSITVQLANAWNICVIGYVRYGSLRVYTHPWRLGL